MPALTFTDKWDEFSTALENAARERAGSIIEDVCSELILSDVDLSDVDVIRAELKALYITDDTIQGLARKGQYPTFHRLVWASAIKAAANLENCVEVQSE